MLFAKNKKTRMLVLGISLAVSASFVVAGCGAGNKPAQMQAAQVKVMQVIQQDTPLTSEYAGQIGIDPAFTIHDREDSADLMNLVRHELGLSGQGKRFPLKGTCLAIYSSAVNTQNDLGEVLQSTFPWCSEWEAELKTLFLGYVAEVLARTLPRFATPLRSVR